MASAKRNGAATFMELIVIVVVVVVVVVVVPRTRDEVLHTGLL